MRFATVHGLFKASRSLRLGQGPETTKFSNNALSACLREDHPNCQKHAVSALTCQDMIVRLTQLQCRQWASSK